MRALRDALTLRSGVTLLLRLVLCGILLYAAVGKWPAPRAFAEDVANYRLLPAALVPLATAGLLGVEVVLGLMLLLGVLLPEAALLTALLTGLFTAAVASALWRGLKIECGCFGAGGSPATTATLLRDVGFLVLALALLALTWRRPKVKGTVPTFPQTR